MDDTNVCLARLEPIAKAGSATLTVSGLKTGTAGVLVGLYDGDQLLASTNVSVIVKQKETPLAIKVSPGSLSLGIGETQNLDLSWSGSVPSGGEIRVQADNPRAVTAKTVSVDPNGTARVAVTGAEAGTSRLSFLLCDRSGNAVCSTQATVTVTAPAEKAAIRAGSDQTIFLGEDEARIVSFTVSGSYADIRCSYDSGLTVREISRTNGQLLYSVAADQSGTYNFSVHLLDSRGKALDSAGYRIEAVFDSTPVTTLPSDHVTLPGNWTVQQG